jgi:phosphatidylinositol alpha-1,6-mannosyltransferase
MYYYHLSRCLGDSVSVLAPDGDGTAEFDASQPFTTHRRRIPIVPTSFMRRSRIGFLRWPRRAYIAATQWARFYRYGHQLIDENGLDVALIGHLYLGPLGPRLRGSTGLPYGIILHGSELHRYMGLAPVQRRALRALNLADFLVVNSDFTRRQYLERGVREDQQFCKVNPGVDTNRFRPDVGDPVAVRRRHGLGDRPLLLSVARLVEWKGQDVVIRAMRSVREAVPDAALLIVGEGPYREALKQLVNKHDLEGVVSFAGFVPESELPSYYCAADLMVVPSREFRDDLPVEGFGIVYMEASACGKPVIGGLGGGTDESILDGETGLRVDQNDPEAVAEAAIRLLEDRELAEGMGRNGRQRAVGGFDWKIQAEHLRRFLNEVAGSGRT